MKDFVLDIILVLFLLCLVSLFFGDNRISTTLFDRSINEFEEKVDNNEQVGQSTIVIQDNSDNQVASFFEGISQTCVQVIEFIVLVFSNMISMIFTVVIY